jgi:hypothetical protein
MDCPDVSGSCQVLIGPIRPIGPIAIKDQRPKTQGHYRVIIAP